jgi:hypothetical protein
LHHPDFSGNYGEDQTGHSTQLIHRIITDQEITNDVSDNSKETDVPKIFLTIEDDQPSLKRKSCGLIALNDQSDPLHNYQKNQDDAIFHSSVTLQET